MTTELFPEHWPRAWLYERVVKEGNKTGETHIRTFTFKGDAERISVEGQRITYRCDCGESFTRQQGFQVAETQAWVIEHTPHLPQPVETD